MTTNLSCNGEDRVEIFCILCDISGEAEVTCFVIETAFVFCEVQAEAEEIVDHSISNII